MKLKPAAKISKAKQLIEHLNKKIDQWDEHSTFTIKGVKNIPRASMDDIKMYAQLLIKNGGAGFHGFMDPRGEVAAVLEKFELVSND